MNMGKFFKEAGEKLEERAKEAGIWGNLPEPRKDTDRNFIRYIVAELEAINTGKYDYRVELKYLIDEIKERL